MGGWRALDVELDAWAATGRTATFWWRDDDATRDGPSLRRLLALADDMEIPLALAVIPADAQDDLAAAIGGNGRVSVLQHGWDHRNHAAAPAKKAELAAGRPWHQAVGDLVRGQGILKAMFPAQFRPVLVPPWNRIDAGLIGRLADAGFIGLSTFRHRTAALAAPGLGQVNCHADPIDWRGSRGYAGDEGTLDSLIAHLRARRAGTVDASEPTGLLTHHAVHDEPCWQFLQRLAEHLRHRAAAWIGIDAALETCR